MKRTEIIEVLEALAQGVDPITGEIFPEDSPYQRAEVVRALYGAVLLIERGPARAKTGDLPAKAGAKWTEPEVDSLVKSFDEGASVEELAESHQRTKGAIRARLIRVGRIQD